MKLEKYTRSLGRKALAPFFTAGYPDEATFLRLIDGAERAGSDLIEIGIPFSDPVADGPLIQASSLAALRQGMNLERVLALTKEAGRRTRAGLLLMGYLNPILSMGLEAFAARAAAAGALGVIIPDVPVEESAPVRAALEREGLASVLLAAPTSGPGRIERIAKAARGFLYLVAVTGVTGAGAASSEEIRRFVEAVKARCDLPLYVGFGIATPKQAAEAAWSADGVIIGSALVRLIREAGAGAVEAFLEEAREALDQGNGRSKS